MLNILSPKPNFERVLERDAQDSFVNCVDSAKPSDKSYFPEATSVLGPNSSEPQGNELLNNCDNK